MRRFLALSVLAACLAVPAPASALNVMTWNVGGGFAARASKGEKPISTFAIARIIAENNAEVVALQEVCRSQLDAIKKDLDGIAVGLGGKSSGFTFRYAPTISPLKCSRADGGSDRSSFGNALLVRSPYVLDQFEGAALPKQRRDRKTRKLVALKDEPRKAAAGTITVDGRAVRVWSLHTTPRCTCPTKKDPNYQLETINKSLLATLGKGLPDQLLLGDLNVRPNDSALNWLTRSALADVDPGNGATTFGKDPHKLDYIFHSRSFSVNSTRVIDPYYHASRWDHRPLFADLSLG